jgi:hypothetical protein
MNTSPEGWTDSEYKYFRVGDDDTSDSDSDTEEYTVRGYYQREKYKKILFIEELVPE